MEIPTNPRDLVGRTVRHINGLPAVGVITDTMSNQFDQVDAVYVRWSNQTGDWYPPRQLFQEEA